MAFYTEHIGVNECEKISLKYGWIFRPQPFCDIGIDAHMELTDESGRVRQLLALQIKSGESWFKNKKKDYVVFSKITKRQYNYWTTNSLPCIVVLYNPNSNICIWQKLTTETIERTKGGKGKGFFVKVPLKQVFLDDESNNQLLSYTNLPEHTTNYNFLLSQKKFMQIIQNGGTIRLHSKEWVNKSSGRGSTELLIDEGNGEKKIIYPYWFPFTLYTDVFPRLFPWASFTVDEDFYEESDKSAWLDLHCYYDKEEDKWINVGSSFEEFRKKLDPMRGIDRAGEVAEYMFILGLNELGRSFLNVDRYVSLPRPYVDARPKTESGVEFDNEEIKVKR